MSKLTQLRVLDLTDNRLGYLPEWISKLTELRSLGVSRNPLTEVPEWISMLSQLEYLGLSGLQLRELPRWLSKLRRLRRLDLSGNRLRELPDWLADPYTLPRLIDLYIRVNPITVPPPEIMADALVGFRPAPLDAIRSYFRQLKAGANVYFYEAKLLIIGEGGAGKTSLARKLKSPNCKLVSDEKSTEGIDITNWSFPIPPGLPRNSDNTSYTAKIWDFGGQEIYFATHQFFLTKRSVYLLVTDTRKQHTDFFTWLLMQETFGGDSPVILVKNRNRQHGNSFSIENLFQLRERFPNLQEPVEVDLNEVPPGTGWNQLSQRVKEQLLQLPHIQQPRPATWVAVRKVIGSEGRNTINRKEFYAICGDSGIKGSEDIKTLAEYMHNVGDILYFQEDLVLQDCVILNPHWGLDAVYRVLDNRGIEQKLGKFSYQDL
ncbi:COR domain-containing protein, partial [Haliangium sp. UPWRP_2]|uniref:COR domain-containing protein n=1 Tax=Haliangium sp. UPWRP_2 TaxID=1931276 RepID=UPI0023EEAAB7